MSLFAFHQTSSFSFCKIRIMMHSTANEIYSTKAEKKKLRKRFPAKDVAVKVNPK